MEKSDACYFGLEPLVTLCGAANAVTMHHAHRRHAIVRSQSLISSHPASGFGYAPLGPPTRYQPGPYTKPYGECFKNWGG
jgi:hypothetical protein